MRAVIQRVSRASVQVDEKNYKASIEQGLVVLLGIGHDDDQDDITWLVNKISAMRIFSDDEGKMNLSIRDINGAMLIISQFTLHASTKKGNRPSFIRAAKPAVAIPLYERFIDEVRQSGIVAEVGIFGAHMNIDLINDGPVTIIIDSKNKE